MRYEVDQNFNCDWCVFDNEGDTETAIAIFPEDNSDDPAYLAEKFAEMLNKGKASE